VNGVLATANSQQPSQAPSCAMMIKRAEKIKAKSATNYPDYCRSFHAYEKAISTGKSLEVEVAATPSMQEFGPMLERKEISASPELPLYTKSQIADEPRDILDLRRHEYFASKSLSTG